MSLLVDFASRRSLASQPISSRAFAAALAALMHRGRAVMCLTGVFGRARRLVLASCFFITFTALLQLPVFAVSSVTLAWDPSTSTNVAGYHIYYGVASRSYTNSISVDLATTATVSGLLEGVTYYFAATALDTAGLESDFSNETSYSVPNQPPTL